MISVDFNYPSNHAHDELVEDGADHNILNDDRDSVVAFKVDSLSCF